MHWIDWLIMLIPLGVIIGLAFYSRRYVRGVADFLAAGRVAGRYVISIGDLQNSLAVISLVAICEAEYQCGLSMSFWSKLVMPLSIFISLTGYVLYRYRQTRCLSMGQFLETRYNRPFRIIAATIRTIAEMMTNAIGPAVAARFFIYMMGFPTAIQIFGCNVSTFAIVVLTVLTLSMCIIWPGGRISLLMTDAIQGLMSYPIFVIFTCFILGEISWHADVAPVMLDRAPGESFLNPNDISGLRDFNFFALIVGIFSTILTRGAWIGNDTSASGRTPHEQKMAGILGSWRNGFSAVMLTLLALFIITVMQGDRFAEKAHAIRTDLVAKVASETIPAGTLQERVAHDVANLELPPRAPDRKNRYSRDNNPDTPYFNRIRQTLDENAAGQIQQANLDDSSIDAANIRGENKAVFQKFRTLYYQMMAPTLLRRELPVGLMGLFILLMAMLMLSTDDSRIFNASSTLVQDVVMPFRKKPFETNEHLWWLRGMSLAVCVFFFWVSMFFAQLDFIIMFINIMCALWLGAAGPIMIGGLYTRWGNTTGAFCALIFGSGTSFIGLICQRNWTETLYPFFSTHGYLPHIDAVFRGVTEYCAPLIVWEMNPEKFPINSYEIFFLAMVFGVIAYTVGSLVTYRESYNLDRMLHRKFADDDYLAPEPWSARSMFRKLIGITPEYSKGDRVIAWSVFGYAIIYNFLFGFVVVAIWNFISPWPPEWWSWYFFITIVVAGLVVGVVSTVWFMWGGVIDLRRLFVDLSKRVDNPLDDGWVEDHVSLADKERLSKKSEPK